MLGQILAKVIGTQNERDLKRLRPLVGEVNAFESRIQALSDDELRGKTAEFRARLQQGETLDELMVAGRGGGSAPSSGERAASLALLRARISGLPGIVLPDPPPSGRARVAPRGPVRLHIDISATGLTGYEVGRRMRKFSGVPLDFCEADTVVAIFDDGDDISTRGSRLLFALSHALAA